MVKIDQIETQLGFPTKEGVKEIYTRLKKALEDGKIVDDPVNHIALEQLEVFIKKYEDVEELVLLFAPLLDKINSFKNIYHRSAIMSQLLFGLFRYVPLPPIERIGILEQLKMTIHDQEIQKGAKI